MFTVQSRRRLEAMWARYAAEPRVAMLFRSCYAEDVRGRAGTGPNLEMGGDGASASDRGIRFFYAWSLANLGRWQFPRHMR